MGSIIDGEGPSDEGRDEREVATTLRAELAASHREREQLQRRIELSANEAMHANAELNALFTALPDLFLRVDVRGRVVDHKGGGAAALGHLLEEEPWNTPLDACLVLDAVEPIRRVLARSWAGDRGARAEYAIGHGPSVRHFEVRALPLPNQDTFIAIEEVTERAANKALLREQQDRATELRSFAAAASHDLRAPLRGIDLLAGFVEEDLDDPEQARAHLAMLRARVRRMEALLTGFLEYAQVGATRVALEDVDSGTLVKGAIDLVVPASFHTTVATDMPIFCTAASLLERVFLNLLSNAVKHHDEETGRITVAYRDVGSCHQFSISDDGPGIPEQHRERAFAMFKRLQTASPSEGVGMGLALIRRVVRGVGGDAELAANEPRGTSAIFRWPKRWPHEPAPPSP